MYFNGSFIESNIYNIEDLLLNDRILGPALIIDKNCTILIDPGCAAHTNTKGDILIDVEYKIRGEDEAIDGCGGQLEASSVLDTTQLSIFSHRFMSIAEQMGRILQRTAVSTNIKERLDYSCAMFDSDGGLVANAPHIPGIFTFFLQLI